MKRFLPFLMRSLLPGLCGCGGSDRQEAAPADLPEEPEFDYIAYCRIDKGDKGPLNSQEHLRYCASLPFTTLKANVQRKPCTAPFLCAAAE